MVRTSQIDRLAALVHPRGSKWRNRFVVIESYLDESGIHDGARICVVAGYYGNHAAWRKVEREWRVVLRRHGLESHGFHAKEFWGRKNGKRVGVYTEWSDEQADQFLDSLVQIIMRNRIFPVGNAIIVAEWKEFSLEQRRFLTGAEMRENGKLRGSGSPNKPYYVPFLFCVYNSVRHSGVNEKVHFFAGLDKTFSRHAVALYQGILKDKRIPVRDLLGNIDFPLSKETPPLQAADMLAYELYRHNLVRFHRNTTKSPTLKRITKNVRSGQSFLVFGRQRLLDLLKEPTE